jgi:hypothetical protein
MGFFMPTITLDATPKEITAGDAVAWRFYSANFPADDGWEVTFALVNAAGRILITAGADGQGHLVDIDAATTAAWAAGDYRWQSYATKGAERYTLDSGAVEILPNFAAQASGYDARPHIYKVRDALEAVIEDRATEAQSSMSIGGRTISEFSHTELMEAQKENARRIMIHERKERRKRGQATGSTIKARF